MGQSNEEDPRVARTRRKLRDGLLEACRTTSLDELSVSGIVQSAGVSRAAFYLHYRDLHALAVDACAEPVRQAVAALHAWETPPGSHACPPEVTRLFASVRQDAQVYRALLSPEGYGPLGTSLFTELSARSFAERDRRFGASAVNRAVAAAVAGTFTGVLGGWLHDRIPGDATEIAERTWRLLSAIHRAL